MNYDYCVFLDELSKLNQPQKREKKLFVLFVDVTNLELCRIQVVYNLCEIISDLKKFFLLFLNN